MVTVAPLTLALRPSFTSTARAVVGLVAELVTVTVAVTRSVALPVPARLRSTAVLPEPLPPQAAIANASRRTRFIGGLLSGSVTDHTVRRRGHATLWAHWRTHPALVDVKSQ